MLPRCIQIIQKYVKLFFTGKNNNKTKIFYFHPPFYQFTLNLQPHSFQNLKLKKRRKKQNINLN